MPTPKELFLKHYTERETADETLLFQHSLHLEHSHAQAQRYSGVNRTDAETYAHWQSLHENNNSYLNQVVLRVKNAPLPVRETYYAHQPTRSERKKQDAVEKQQRKAAEALWKADKEEGSDASINFRAERMQDVGSRVMSSKEYKQEKEILEKRLTAIEEKEKAELLEDFGIDNLLVIKFDDNFRQLSSEEFVRDYLVGKLGMKSMIVGYNHHFGHNRSGGFDNLGPLQQELGFSLTRVDKFDMGCGKISSTEIRKLLTEGDVTKAAKLLDYQYFIIGQADHSGQFTPDMPNKIIPGEGLYNVVINGTSYHLLINGNKQLTIKDFNHCQQNIKITFTEKIG